MSAANKRTTVTFQPSEDVHSLLSKAVNREVRKLSRRKTGRKGATRLQRGIRTKLINDKLREAFAPLIGKREQSKAN